MDSSVSSYRTVDVLGKSQVELVIKVYDGAIGSMRSAADCYRQEKLQEGHASLEKAKSFVVHLYTTLDSENGGEVAENLAKLYTHVVCQMDIVAATKDLAILDDMINVMANLRAGWSELKEQQAQNDRPVAEPAVTDSLSISG